MRWRETVEQGKTPEPVYDGILVVTAGLGLFIGIVLYLLARRARLMWLYTWGAGLALSSAVYIVHSLFIER